MLQINMTQTWKTSTVNSPLVWIPFRVLIAKTRSYSFEAGFTAEILLRKILLILFESKRLKRAISGLSEPLKQ